MQDSIFGRAGLIDPLSEDKIEESRKFAKQHPRLQKASASQSVSTEPKPVAQLEAETTDAASKAAATALLERSRMRQSQRKVAAQFVSWLWAGGRRQAAQCGTLTA